MERWEILKERERRGKEKRSKGVEERKRERVNGEKWEIGETVRE